MPKWYMEIFTCPLDTFFFFLKKKEEERKKDTTKPKLLTEKQAATMTIGLNHHLELTCLFSSALQQRQPYSFLAL